MYLLRALFWTGVLSLFVPFHSFDLARGDIRVDRPALMREIGALPDYCDRRADVCDKARDVLALMRSDAQQVASEVFNERNLHDAAVFAQQVLSADQPLITDERTGLRMRP